MINLDWRRGARLVACLIIAKRFDGIVRIRAT